MGYGHGNLCGSEKNIASYIARECLLWQLVANQWVIVRFFIQVHKISYILLTSDCDALQCQQLIPLRSEAMLLP